MKKLIVLVAAMVMVAGYASAAEWNFYGSARVYTQFQDHDNAAPTADFTNYTQGLQGNSRIGANVKVSDELIGRFEYGSGPNLRLLYGTWNFGGGEFTVGQFWTPVNVFLSNQVWGGDNGLGGMGQVYNVREAGLELKFGGFKIAVLPPNTNALTATSVETSMPKIEAAYNLSFDGGAVNFRGGYENYEVKTATYTSDIDSYVGSIDAVYNFGAGWWIGGTAFAGQNLGVYQNRYGAVGMIWTGEAGGNGQPIVSAAGLVTDSDQMGFAIVAGAKLNDTFSFEAGYGYAETELDVGGSFTDDVASYYLQTTVTLAPGVFFVPEIGVVDFKDNAAGNAEAKYNYYMVKWQINF